MSTPFEEKREEALEETLEEGSTIFSAPEEKSDRVRKPGLLKKLLLGVAALIVLAGIIVAVVVFISEMTTNEAPAGEVVEWYMLDAYATDQSTTAEDGTVTVTQTFDFDAISKLKLTSEKLTLEFYSNKGDGEDVNTVWLESSIAQDYTSETTAKSLVEAALGLKYSRIISETVEADVDYGFDKPVYTMLITPYEGDEFTVTVGKQSPDQSGYYVTVSNDGKVYLVRSQYITKLELEDKMELTKALSVSAFSETEGSAEYYSSGSLVKFDHMYFTNSNLDKTYKFITAERTETQSYNTYMIAEPIARAANDVGIVPIIELFSNGIDSQGLYAVTKTDADIKAFGLDVPDLEVSLKAGVQERTIKAKLQEDGNYALISSDMDVILNVPAANLTPATLKEKDIYSVFLFIETLVDVEEFILESGDIRHTIGIVTEYNEEASSSTITGIKINGAEASAPEEFQSYYQFLLGITAVSYEKTDISGKRPVTTITMTKKDGSAATVIEYYEGQNGRYQVVVNGGQVGLISSSNYKNITKYATNVVNGKLYNS